MPSTKKEDSGGDKSLENNLNSLQSRGNELLNDIKNKRALSEIKNNELDYKSRSKIAFIFTWAFVICIAVIIIFGPIYNASVGQQTQVDVTELLSNFCSHFGTVLGFVLGYYFKDRSSK